MAHASASVFKELWLHGELCDAVIRVQDEDFQVHKIILSGCSEYFRLLFTSSHPADRVYKVDLVSPDMMRLIIEFAYIGYEEVNQQNVEELYVACGSCKVTGLMEACGRFLGEHLSEDNCIDIWQLSETYFCRTLNDTAFHFVVRHFIRVCASSEFLTLSPYQLLKLIDADRLLVMDPRIVFEASLRWIVHSPEERKTYISQILPKVRLALMNLDYFMKNVRHNEMVLCDTACQDTVKTAETLLSGGKVPESGTYHPLVSPCPCVGNLFAIGGLIKNDVAAIEAYDICTGRWVSVTNTEDTRRINYGAVFLNGSVYWVGSHFGDQLLSSVQRFELATHTQHQVEPMKTQRGFYSITALNGRIYAIGGNDNTAECYDPETDQWMEVASMHEYRRQASCTAFKGKVYVCGGRGGNGSLSSAEYYSPETDRWTTIAPMSTGRFLFGIVVFEERIYAVGGYDKDTCLSSAEAYDPQTDTWHDVPPMLSPRLSFAIEVVDGRLFVIGGFQSYQSSSSIESYDPHTETWSEVRVFPRYF